MDEKKLVVQANSLIENKPSMDMVEMRLFLSAISLVSKEDEDFKEYKISVSEFADVWNMEQKSAYRQVKEALVSLSGRTWVFEDINPETRKTRFFSVTTLSTTGYEDGQGYCYLKINPEFKPYLLSLKEKYTKYILANVMQLKRVHSIRTYELLKQYENIGKRSFSVSGYKKFLGVEGKYRLNADLKRYVIEPAVEEINKYTDIRINFKMSGRGDRAVINYSIHSKKVIVPKLDLLKIAEDMLNKYETEKTAQEYISFLKSIVDVDKAKDPDSYMKACIKNPENVEMFLNQVAMDIEKRANREAALQKIAEIEEKFRAREL